jgi:Berberine and berberine like
MIRESRYGEVFFSVAGLLRAFDPGVAAPVVSFFVSFETVGSLFSDSSGKRISLQMSALSTRWRCISVKAMWAPHQPDGHGFPEWVRDRWERLRPFSTGRSYINFQTADEDNRIRATYGANFDRLLELKQTYDPDNLFRSNRNIRPGTDGGGR